MEGEGPSILEVLIGREGKASQFFRCGRSLVFSTTDSRASSLDSGGRYHADAGVVESLVPAGPKPQFRPEGPGEVHAPLPNLGGHGPCTSTQDAASPVNSFRRPTPSACAQTST